MRFVIKHEIKGRLRVHILQSRMSFAQADTLQYYLDGQSNIVSAKIQERTLDVTVVYTGSREEALKTLENFTYQGTEVPENYLANSGREMNREYKDQLINKVVMHYGIRLFLPVDIRSVITTVKSFKYLWHGVKTLVCVVSDGQEILVPSTSIKSGDLVRIHMGNVIPFDGTVTDGEGMVNQASLTGESVPVRKIPGGTVYAGTVVEEGELTICVKENGGSSKYEKIMTMIEESEKLKSSLEGKAEHLADKLVPYTFLGTGLVWLFTRNVTKALSVLMVDFSCALKLSMPLAVLSAIREASTYEITVKGGKYLEAMADATTIVFDKTGTLTKAQPTVADVVSFNGQPAEELLRIAACLEEHFPHSMAKAVVREAARKELVHEELHTKVEYIVAHGISSTLEGKKIIIGSYHFVFEDEQAQIPEGRQELFDQLPEEYSRLYMAIDGKLAAVICIEDPLREEAPEVIRQLKSLGIHKVVMMTGDSDRIAGAIAGTVGVDEYYSEVLPEDKARFVEHEKQAGHKVIMIGDGINDSPALSAADVGIAISEGAQIAREIADVTIGADNLYEVATLKELSNSLMERIHKNYRMIVGINTGLIILGVAGIIPPTTSALLHNTSTLWISTKSMKNLLDKEEV